MRKSLYVLLAATTIGLFIMTLWTGSIFFSVISQRDQSVTDNIQYIEDDPIEGQVTISVRSKMYEGILSQVYFNISLMIQGSTAMNLTIESIIIVLSPLDLENRTEADLPKYVGVNNTQLNFENVRFVNIEGIIEIRPVIITGEIYLGCGIEWILRNGSLSGPCEYGNNCWFGTDGSLFMTPVIVYPAFLQLQGWSYGFVGTLLIWMILVVYNFKKNRTRTNP